MTQRTVNENIEILIEGLSIAADQLIAIQIELKGLREDLRIAREQAAT
jgi:hypothetical protein